MIQSIVSSEEPITLIGAGAVGPRDLAEALTLAPCLVAADGGADKALENGHMPRAVIGDFDSLSPDTRSQIPDKDLYHIAEQDSTDFEKVLTRVAAPLCIGVGFMGERVDHQLAALHVLLAYADRAVILLSDYEVIVHCPPRLTLTVPENATVSLFPLTAVEGTSTGLEWPIDGLKMAPGRQVGTSNRATEPTISLTMQGRGMLGLFPRAALGPVAQALQAHGQPIWPTSALAE